MRLPVKIRYNWIFYVLLLVPLFFVNIRDSHDWGDDFAQYIHQAENIVEGKPQSSTGYIFNSKNAFIGPPAYSSGFPLLLAPVFGLFGNNMTAFMYFNTFLLFLYGFIIITFLKQNMSELTAALMSVILIYNPWTLNFKSEILSDIAFSLVLLIIVQLFLKTCFTKSNIFRDIIFGFLLAYLVLIKSTGLIVLLSIVAALGMQVLSYFRKRESAAVKNVSVHLIVILIATTLLFLLVNNVIFSTGASTFSYFKTLYTYDGLKQVFSGNLAYYINNFHSFFQPQCGFWNFIPLIIKSFALTFLVIGLVITIVKTITFPEILFIGYLLSVCFFPNSTQGFRYILPIMPLAMYYIVKGFEAIKPGFHVNRYLLHGLIFLLFFVSYKTEIIGIVRNQSQVLSGPQEPEATEVFNYIKENTDADDTIVFIKPRALALYTSRNSMANHPGQKQPEITASIEKLRIKYFLLTNDIENASLKEYVKAGKNIVLRFRNNKFEFYQKL